MPAVAFAGQRVSARNLVLSANKQAAAGTALADAVLLRRQRFDGSSAVEMTPTRRSDKAMAGKGTEFATDGQLTGWDSKFAFKAEADSWLIGWALALAMGIDTPTGEASPYTHALTFDETDLQQACTTIYVEDTQDQHFVYPDMALSDLTLTIPARGACTLDVTLMGTGRYTAHTIAAMPAIDTAAKYLLGNDCSFAIGPVGAPVDITGRHLGTTLKITTGVENHTAPGGGLNGVFMRHGVFGFNIQSVIAAKDTDDINGAFLGDTLKDLKWTINSGAAAQLVFEAGSAKFKANKLGKSGQNMVVWNLELDDTSAFAQGGNPALAVSVINSLAAYLTAS
jgi:hypothetical protein